MKTLRNRHSRNRTYRRVQRGGYSIEKMQGNIAAIKAGEIDNFANARANFIELVNAIKEREFKQAIAPLFPIPGSETISFGGLENMESLFTTVNGALGRLEKTTDRKGGVAGRQELSKFPSIVGLVKNATDMISGVLHYLITRPRKANVDWFPSLQKLHRISMNYDTSRKPTQGSSIIARFNSADAASQKDARENRKADADARLLSSIEKFSDGTLNAWFNKLRNLVNVPTPLREQAIAEIWEIVPADMPSELRDELHTIFDIHTAFLAEKEFTAPVAEPLQAQEKPERPGRKVLVPRAEEPLAAAAALPLPLSAPESPILRGEPQPELKESSLPPQPPRPAPGLGIPESVQLAAPVARRVDKAKPTGIISASLPATPALPALAPSVAPPPIVSPGPREKVVPQYISAAVPGLTVLEKGAVPIPSDRAPLPVRTQGEVPVHEPLPELPEGAAPPGRIPAKEPGLFDGLTSLVPSFLSSPAPASQLEPTPALSTVNKPGTSVVPEYTAQPPPSTASQLPLLPPTRFNPLDRTFTPPAPEAYNPFQSYVTPPLASVTSGPLASPGTKAPYSFLNPETQVPSNTSLATQATPAVPGLKSEEQIAFEKGAYQSIDTSKSLCERLHPRLYEILKTGQFNGKSIFTLLNEQGPELQTFFSVIQFDIAAKTLMGHPISEIYKACHPDRTIGDPNLTAIFQVLQALYNYTGVKQPVLDLPSILRIASSPAPAIGAVQQPGRPDRKPSAPEPPVDFSRMFKKGDRLRPIEILTDPSTGQSPILTVVGDYNADTQSIEVSYGGETMSVPVRGLHYRFNVIRRSNTPEKKLFKKGERVLMKLPGNLARLPQALRTEIEKGSCTAPFYATVQADQDARSEKVIIKCDKGPEKPFSVLDSQLSYGVKALEVSPQPNPVAPLAVDGSAPLRRGLAEVKTSNPAKTPETMTDCDRQLFTMTERAKTCETKLATLQQELAEMTAANKAETERLQADIAAEKARLAQLQASKTEVEQNLKTATQTEQTLREHIGTYGKQLGEFRTKTDALEGQNRSIKDEIAATTARLQQTEQEIARLNQQSAEDSARFEQLNKVLRKANDERNDLIGRLAQSTSELTKATQEQENLQAAYTKKLVELEVAKDSLADLNTRFATTDALITAADQRITHQLAAISGTLNEEIDNIAEGIKYAIGLTEETRGDIAASRAEFTRRFGSLQQDLAVSNLETRTSIIAEMRDLRASNEQNMAALQANLAATTAEKNQLQHQIAEEQAAKARVEGELEAKKQEIARKEQEYAQALDAARQTASNTAQQLQDAYTTASQAEVIRLQDVHGANIARLTSQLSAAIARAAAAETNTEDRNRLTAGLTEELVRLRAQIAAIPPPAPVVVPPPAVAPRIISRSPEGDVQVGKFITITWNSNRTPGPWILRVDYNGTNPDFQEVTLDQDISYQIKRPGALSGRIYSVTQV